MTTQSRKIPWAPDPMAAPFHSAMAQGQIKLAKEPHHFAWWYVDNHIGAMTVQQAWDIAPDWMKARR